MIADQAADELLFDLRDGVGRVTFNRPRLRNALTFPMYERLTEICERADTEPTMKVLILTGAGEASPPAPTSINFAPSRSRRTR